MTGTVVQSLAILTILAASSPTAAAQEYWVCANAQGVRSAQDRSCTADQHTISVPASARATPQSVPPPLVAPSSRQAPPMSQLRTPQPVSPSASVFQPIINVVWKASGTIILLLFVITAAKIILAPRERTTRVGRRSTVPNAARAARPPAVTPPLSRPTEWTRDLLSTLEWKRFEEVCEGYWRGKGYPARSTGPGADGGVDVSIADRVDAAKVFAVAQCKSWSKPVGVEPVRALWGSRDHFGAHLALFYSMNGFTDDARAFAVGKHLKLIDGDELLRQVKTLPDAERSALLDHVIRGDYSTPSCPKCEIKMVRKSGRDGKRDYWSCPQFATCHTRGIPITT
jgi:hypothetical protein